MIVGGSERITGVARACFFAESTGCESDTGVDVPELGLTNSTGSVCRCSEDLCTSPAAHTAVASGRFTVASLLALAAIRLLRA